MLVRDNAGPIEIFVPWGLIALFCAAIWATPWWSDVIQRVVRRVRSTRRGR
jgi:hypothetical protein